MCEVMMVALVGKGKNENVSFKKGLSQKSKGA